MTFEKKRAWVFTAVSVAGYAVYLVVVLGRFSGQAPADVSYVGVMLTTIGAAIVAAILLEIVLAAAGPQEDGPRKDQRDRDIERFGEHIGQSFLVIGGVAALVLAMVEADHFWIANAVYLAFFLSAVLGAVARIVAYRRGLPW